MSFGDHVQSTGVDLASGTSGQISLPGALTAGNALVLGIRFSLFDPGTVGVTDSLGHTWNTLNTHAVSGSGSLYCFYVLSCQGGANTVTVTNTNSSIRRIILAEYTGPALAPSTNKANGTSNILSCGLLTVSAIPALLVGFGTNANGRTFTAGSGYTERQEIAQRIALEDQTVSSANDYTPTMTLSSSDSWLGIGAAFAEDSQEPPAAATTLAAFQRPLRIWRR